MPGIVSNDLERCLGRYLILQILHTPASGDVVAERWQGLRMDGGRRRLAVALARLQVEGLVRAFHPAASGEKVYALTTRGQRHHKAFTASYSRWREALVDAEVVHLDEISTMAGERAALAALRQDLERQRSDLLSTVSHELRTPLTLIRTSVGLLLDSTPEPAMQERLLRNVKHSADRMHGLVNDLLDLVRLNSGKAELQLRYVDICELVTATAGLMGALLEQKGQSLRLDTPSRPLRAMADHRRLEQVLLNLLSNANKFAPRGAAITVQARGEGSEAVVSVADSGPGIPPEAQTHLFEQFYTARTSSLSHNIGAGLGLPIAKGIVEAHGGRMWVESALGAGSTFYFSLPLEGPGKDGRDEDSDSG